MQMCSHQHVVGMNRSHTAQVQCRTTTNRVGVAKALPSCSRRALWLGGLGGLVLPSFLTLDAQASQSAAPGIAETLIHYSPARDKTPAIRAGIIRPETSYSFDVPAPWKEARLSNNINGNFCMPSCGEPWTEAIFEEGSGKETIKIALLAVPLNKLTNKKLPSTQDLGTPETLITKIGPYITGNYYDADEDTLKEVKVKTGADGLQYWQYEIFSPHAVVGSGPYSLCSTTAKGEVLFLFICTASEKLWNKQQGTLRAVLDSFVA